MKTSTRDGVRVGEKQARRGQGCLQHIINVFANFKRSERLMVFWFVFLGSVVESPIIPPGGPSI